MANASAVATAASLSAAPALFRVAPAALPTQRTVVDENAAAPRANASAWTAVSRGRRGDLRAGRGRRDASLVGRAVELTRKLSYRLLQSNATDALTETFALALKAAGASALTVAAGDDGVLGGGYRCATCR